MDTTSLESDDTRSYFFWLHFWKRAIGAVEVLGGIYGLYIVLAAHTVGSAVFVLVLLVFALLYSLVSVVSGVLLLLGRPGGLAGSLFIQAMQLFQVHTGSILYVLTCGFQVLFGCFFTGGDFNFGVRWSLGSGFQFFLNPPPEAMPQPNGMGFTYGTGGVITGVNVVALASIICLLLVGAAQRAGNSAVKPHE
jgi:hypothetical protein